MKKYTKFFVLVLFSNLLFNCFGNKSTNRPNIEKQKLVTALKQYDWEAPEKVFSLIEPSIHLTESSNYKTGDSKYGGTPDLPATMSWPMYKEKPMVFFGQINLSQTRDLDKENLLPKSGILYFFTYFDAPESEYGAEYLFQMEKDRYKVLFFDGDTKNIEKTQFPEGLPVAYHFKEEAIKMEIAFGLPTSYSSKQEAIGFSENDTQLYDTVLEEYDYFQAENILGTPCPIQDPVEFDWAYSYLQSTDYSDEQIKNQVNALRPDFINLFSFSMYDRFETIGTSDCYFGIQKSDLDKKEFSQVVFVMQDT